MSERRTPPAQEARPGPFGRGPMATQMVEKPKNFKKTMGTLISYLRPFRLWILVVLLFAIASTTFAVISPKILGNMTNTIVYGYQAGQTYDEVMKNLPAGVQLPAGTTGADILNQMPASARDSIPAEQREQMETMDFSHRPGIDFDHLKRMGMLLVLLYSVSAAFAYAQGYIMAGVAQRVSFDMRERIAQKINHMPLRYFDARTHGEVLSRVTNDVDTVSQTLNQSLGQIVTSVVTVIGILIMMLTISWKLTLIAVLILPLSFGLIRLIVGRSQQYFKQQQASLGDMNGHIEEMFTGHQVMRVFGGEAASIQKFRGDQHHALRQRLEIAVLFRSDDAGHVVRRKPWLRRGFRGWWLSGAAWRHSYRRPAGLHSIHEPAHPANHPGGQRGQRAPVNRRGGRAGIRISRRSGGTG